MVARFWNASLRDATTTPCGLRESTDHGCWPRASDEADGTTFSIVRGSNQPAGQTFTKQ
jgi:hypothetical protein